MNKSLVGNRFGRLVVQSQAPTLRYSRWHCLCDCGNTVIVSRQLLQMGESGTRSCGCLRRETCRKNGYRFAELMAQRQREPSQRNAGCTLSDVWR
jgi:hypothetical protein